MLNLLEKLINEHGSSTILKERITAIKEEYTRLECEKNSLQVEVNSLKSLLSDKEFLITSLQKELIDIRDTINCDHCNSPDTYRTGVRNDPDFKLFTVKQFIYGCVDCKKVTYISEGID
ncbi:hypothetical protein GNP84_18800 [Aliivibrio fischeri]|uniref:hypothetical protein n=1 Tax=Aliivibrio fischeri TaxID=668 RepID=UPI0012D99B8A|nr:hypothetical protein [Aliivibrio fischeri]MUK78932.1 hypothetical protein [Aliivibrio fischeri]